MSFRKKMIGLACAVVVSTLSWSVWAACGDTACGYVGGTYTCYVETDRGVRSCTAADPCDVSC